MTFGTIALRALTFAGLWATSFWSLAFLWTAFQDPPPGLALVVLTASVILGCVVVWFRRWPSALEVPEGTEWFVLLRRLAVGALITYFTLAAMVYGIAFGLVLTLGSNAAGDTQAFVTTLALWFPIWPCPIGASALAWSWSRKEYLAAH